MEQANVSKLIYAFVLLILGIVVIGTIADVSSGITTKVSLINETINIADARNVSGTTHALNYSVDIFVANYPTDWKTTECVIGGFSLVNQSGTVLTATTDYDFTPSTGAINFYNTLEANMSGTSNLTYGSYNYCNDDYLTQSWSRSITNLIAGFVAITLLLISIGLFYSVFSSGEKK